MIWRVKGCPISFLRCVQWHGSLEIHDHLRKAHCSIICLLQLGWRTLACTLDALQNNHSNDKILYFLPSPGWTSQLHLLYPRNYLVDNHQQLAFCVVVAFLVRWLSTMRIPPGTRHVCKIQATKGRDNFHIYLVCLFLDDHLLHLIQTQWVSHSYFSFPFWGWYVNCLSFK